MARSKSRSRSVGRGEDGYVSDDTVRPFKRVKKKGKASAKSPKKVQPMLYKVYKPTITPIYPDLRSYMHNDM